MKKVLFFLVSLIILTCILFCSKPVPHTYQPFQQYEKNKLEKLDDLQKSILKITCTAYYENYYYEKPISMQDTTQQDELLIRKNITSNSVAGTGLILYHDSMQMALLTCFHVFDFKDTLRSYYIDENKKTSKFLSAESRLIGKNIYVFHRNGRNSQAKIVAFDDQNDLALIVTEPANIALSEFAFEGSYGDANKLKLGQEVYLLGFPKGFFMVSRGLVSPTGTKKRLLVDATFNQGFSGGIVVAFDETFSNYSYVGMSNSVAYSSEMILAPIPEIQEPELYFNYPYKEDIFIKELKSINYGITFVVKSNVVAEFINEQLMDLKNKGYNFRIDMDIKE